MRKIIERSRRDLSADSGVLYPKEPNNPNPKYGLLETAAIFRSDRKNYFGDAQDNRKLYQIVALRDIDGSFRDQQDRLRACDPIRKGDLGGFVAGWQNLSQDGRCWIYPGGCVADEFMVLDDSLVQAGGVCTGHGELRGQIHTSGRIKNALIQGRIMIRYPVEISGVFAASAPPTLGWTAVSILAHDLSISGRTLITDSAKIQCHVGGITAHGLTPKEGESEHLLEISGKTMIAATKLTIQGRVVVSSCSLTGNVNLSPVGEGKIMLHGGRFNTLVLDKIKDEFIFTSSMISVPTYGLPVPDDCGPQRINTSDICQIVLSGSLSSAGAVTFLRLRDREGHYKIWGCHSHDNITYKGFEMPNKEFFKTIGDRFIPMTCAFYKSCKQLWGMDENSSIEGTAESAT
jgi:hypothetical protein